MIIKKLPNKTKSFLFSLVLKLDFNLLTGFFDFRFNEVNFINKLVKGNVYFIESSNIQFDIPPEEFYQAYNDVTLQLFKNEELLFNKAELPIVEQVLKNQYVQSPESTKNLNLVVKGSLKQTNYLIPFSQVRIFYNIIIAEVTDKKFLSDWILK